MDKRKFHIPFIPLVVGILLAISPMLIIGVLSSSMIWMWIGLTVGLISYSVFILVVEIGSDGVRIYRINMLRWDDVNSAKIINFLGLRYLFVKRNKGMNYWIPLYFKGSIDIETALRENAPAENPITSCL